LPPGDEVKTKKPTAIRQWVDKFVNESRPDCRADQQRVCKQQVQVAVHGKTIAIGL
jgi:hypothetical protein